ncbi:MAG: hypothetical protein M3Y82_10640 [Verrucomicrobiota bacterium]|nr:hypothetical protein [Verrucomicrobiota bacterium]
MPDEAQHISVSTEALERRHESRDPHLRNPLIVVASVVVMILFCLATAGVLVHTFSEKRAMQRMRSLGLIAAPDLKPLTRFHSPNLEIDDGHADELKLGSEQKAQLNSYGWIDHSNGVVRIPIARAMDLLAQRGLPTRTNGVSQTGASPLQMIQQKAENR